MIVYAVAALAVLAAVTVACVGLSRPNVAGDTPAERVEAIRRLTHERPWGAAAAIAAVAGDPDAAVRAAVLVALSQFDEPRYRGLVERGCADTDPSVRSAGSDALAVYADAEAVQRLADLAASDPDPAVRARAIGALRQCPAPHAICRLVGMMEDPGKPAAQSLAAKALIGRFRMSPLEQYASPNNPRWGYLVEFIKARTEVAKAFQATGGKLLRHPERLAPGGAG